jgi:hypothetical protein
MRSGVEWGRLERPFSERAGQGDGMKSNYLGFVNEASVGRLPLDPRVLLSIELHGGSERTVATYHDATGGVWRSDHTHPTRGIGFGLGASVGINPTRQVSARAEERIHLTPVGLVHTVSLAAIWRP